MAPLPFLNGSGLWLLAALAQPASPPAEAQIPDEETPPVNAALGNLGLDVSTPFRVRVQWDISF